MNGEIKFTPNTAARFEAPIEFYYACEVGNLDAVMYAKVTIIPATSIYYEDTAEFIGYTNSSLATTGGTHDGWGKWTTVGEASDVNYLFENIYSENDTYGYSSANSANYQYSAGSAKKVTYGPENFDSTYSLPAGEWESQFPTVEFTFKGTGVTVYSATGKTSGLLFVTISGEGGYLKEYAVNNYFGYTYSEGSWVADTSSANTSLYQVPVLDYELPSYDTYTVKIRVSYDKYMDVANVGYTEFYFDGFRVHNPLGTSVPSVAEAQYKANSEYDPKFLNIRDCVIGDLSSSGTVFADGSGLARGVSLKAADYKDIGPKKEVMLGNTNAVSFKLSATSIPDKVALGAKVTHGTAGELTVTRAGGSTQTITLTSGTDMYYDITLLLDWTLTDGVYKTSTVTITNTTGDSGNIISLTTLKFSTGSETLPTPTVNFAAGNENDTWEALADIFGYEYVVGDVDGDGIVNLKDLAELKSYISNLKDLSKYDIKAADADENKVINLKDISALKTLIAE